MGSESESRTTQMRATEVLPMQGGQPSLVYVRQKANWRRRLLLIFATLGLIVALVFGLKAVDLFPQIHNPFATQVTDRSGPVLLLSVKDMSRYVAAEGNFQVVVNLQENKRFIPDIIFNDHTLFVGVGTVDAYVDFGAIGDGAVVVSPDGKSVEVNLPAPQLTEPALNVNESYTFAEDRGLINSLGDLIGGDPNKQQQLYQLASTKIADVAQKSELRDRAAKNTTAMLESLIKALGYEHVTVNYAAP